MTRVKRLLLYTFTITLVLFPSPHVRASDDTLEQPPETIGEQVIPSVNTNQAEVIKPTPTETSPEPLTQPVVQSNIVVQPQPVVLPASPVMITGYQVADNGLHFFQLYNNSSDILPLDGWKLEYKATLGNEEVVGVIDLHAYLLPKQYAAFSQEGFLTNPDSTYNVVLGSGFKIDRLQLIPPHTYANNQVTGGTFSVNVRYELTKSSAGNYTSTSKFVPVLEDSFLAGKGLYAYPEDNPLRVVEILANTENCPPLDERTECHEYVKLYNSSADAVDISTYRLRLGYGNQAPGIANSIKLSGVMEPQGYTVVQYRDDGDTLDITASGGGIWLEDTHGLKTYAATVQSYQDIGDASHKGHSWALDENDQTWKWAVPTPNGPNNFSLPMGMGSAGGEERLTPCRPDQERNPETNRCRLIADSNLTPCGPGQYRSEETNRCRSLVSTASSLTPCAPNQIRNSETNRCRSLASGASTLVPCAANQERNPETNRCRNKTGSDVPDAAFAVQPVKDSGKAFIGWWALGGVGLIALGYGAWEWRREMLSGIRKVATFFTSRK